MGIQLLTERRISTSCLRKTIEDLAKFGGEPGGGVTRLAFTEPELLARRYIVDSMLKVGLEVGVDQIGNLIGRRPGNKELPVVAFGSHVDTVPHGGRFDGVAGVAAGLEVMRVLNLRKLENIRPIELVIFSGEEGSRFPFQLGSRTMAGLLSIQEASALEDKDGVTVGDSIRQALDDSKMLPAERFMGNFHAWLELHVEQGPVLEKNGLDVGLVTDIVGLELMIVRFYGRSGHAGTNPMSLRRDPMIGAAQVIRDIPHLVRGISASIVATVGSVIAYPGAFNTIPRVVEFTVDLRDASLQNIRKAGREIRRKARWIARERHLIVSFETRASSEPVRMDLAVLRLLAEEARNLGLGYRLMPSGAGHDTQNIAKIAPCGMIFVPSKNGLSHVPEEFTNWTQLARGAELMLEAVRRLAA